MNLALGPQQERFQRNVAEFTKASIEPVAGELDRAGTCTSQILDAVAEAGLFGTFIPPSFGGVGEDYVAYVAALQEISGAWAALGAIISVHNSLVCYPILRFGDDQQRKHFLPRLTTERELGCYAFAEPAAGSDAGGIQTTATADGDSFVLNGQKVFVTSGRQARIAIVYALTDPSRGRDGLSAFLVNHGTPGFSVGQREEMLGLRAAETVELSFHDCRIPKGHLLGGLNRGFEIARAVVEGGRIDIAAQSVGIAQACVTQSVGHAKTRRQFGRPIAEFEAIQWMLADMQTELDAARLLMYRAASRRAKEQYDGTLAKQASMAKLFASEAANRAAYNAVQVFGGHGYLTEFPVERFFRDARAMTLYEETSEIERLVIERELARTND